MTYQQQTTAPPSLLSLLSGHREPFAGMWSEASEAAPPMPVRWCSLSARVYALALGLSARATGRKPGPFTERLEADVQHVAPLAHAEALALARANLSGDDERAREARSKCAELEAILRAIVDEGEGRVHLSAGAQASRISRVRQDLATAIRSAPGPVDAAELAADAREAAGEHFIAGALFAR
jgi:hypothetical protein